MTEYELKVEVVRLSSLNATLERKVELLTEQLSVARLTTDELQSIHGLIQTQISLISSLQTIDDVFKVHAAVTPLTILVSLVSKPTD